MIVLRRRSANPVAVWATMLGVAVAVAALPPLVTAGLLIASVVFALALARPGVGLALVALSIPLGSLIELRTGPLPAGPTDGIVAVVSAGWLASVFTRRREWPSLGPFGWPILVFLGAVVLSASFAASLPAATKESLRWLELFLVYLAASNLVRVRREAGGQLADGGAMAPPGARARTLPDATPARDGQATLRLVLAAILVAGSVEAMLGVVQFFTRAGPAAFRFGPFLRAYGTFGQPNPFAGYLGMIFPLCLALVLLWRPEGRDWLWRLCLPALALIGVAIAMSLSRGGWMGVGLASGLVVVLMSRRAALLALVAGIAGGIVLFLGAMNALPTIIAQRIESAAGYFRFFDTRGVFPTPTNWAIVERMAHWQAAWEMLVDHPLVGVGPGHYVVAYADYAVLPFWRDPLGHAHNIYLHLAAELGVIGLATYLVMVATWIGIGLAAARRLGKEEPRGLGRALALGATASLVAPAIHNLFDNLYVHGMNVHVGLLLGVIAAAATASRAAPGQTGSAPENQSRPERLA